MSMNQTRYRIEKVELSPEDAKKAWKWEIAQSRSEIKELRAELKAARERYRELLNGPLITERTRYVEVKPGDEGYDELPDGFSERHYQGGFKWVNIPNNDRESNTGNAQ